jgi:hypothetical protein
MKSKSYLRQGVFALIAGAVILAAASVTGQVRRAATHLPQIAPAPNEPAKVGLADGKVVLTYAGQTIFEAAITSGAKSYERRVQSFRRDDKVEQAVYIFGAGRSALKLAGTVRGSEESFPCEADRRDRRGAGPLVVRHVSGLSRSLLNRAVYDRKYDWVLSVDANPAVTIVPLESGPEANIFALTAEGSEIVLRFRPRFYQKHRGLAGRFPVEAKIVEVDGSSLFCEMIRSEAESPYSSL